MAARRMEPELLPHGRAIRPRSPAEMLEPARAPARPKGRRVRREPGRFSGFIQVLSGLLTVGLVGLAVLGGLLFLANYQFTSPGPLAEGKTVVIPRGEGRIEIATRLERDGIIANRWVFIVNHLFRTRLLGEKLEMKAGEYEIAERTSMRDVMEVIAAGRGVSYKLTLPEGLTSQQIVERLTGEDQLSGDVVAIPPEGTLLPDTYSFSKDMPREAVIARMQRSMQELIAEEWPKRQPGLPIATPEEAIILASIVEKETGLADERGRVAAVFVNRLRKGMRLQSDPTIIYGIVGGKGSLGRAILRSDIDQKTAYNTYQISGLPPTPICNPGADAIRAVLNPPASKDLFFVADGTGGHKFSETLAEHNAAVANWRKVEREARRREAEAAASDGKAAGAERTPAREVPGAVLTDASADDEPAGAPAAPARTAGALPATRTAAVAEAPPAETVARAMVTPPLPSRKPLR
ncbi:MAG: endolytic transglycosylase MltG [Hyphomicrobiaceae bacterium]|nr:endolytic transglycosylase MltG [Hyphomicrobiaceae bacterium]